MSSAAQSSLDELILPVTPEQGEIVALRITARLLPAPAERPATMIVRLDEELLSPSATVP